MTIVVAPSRLCGVALLGASSLVIVACGSPLDGVRGRAVDRPDSMPGSSNVLDGAMQSDAAVGVDSPTSVHDDAGEPRTDSGATSQDSGSSGDSADPPGDSSAPPADACVGTWTFCSNVVTNGTCPSYSVHTETSPSSCACNPTCACVEATTYDNLCNSLGLGSPTCLDTTTGALMGCTQ
jgi:hypothetical protein